jgi:hypothetical protein
VNENIIKHLDPGIRNLVVALNKAGFVTTDSGDGVSKPECGRMINVPHVVIKAEPSRLLLTANALHDWCRATKLKVTRGMIQATYDPVDKSAIVMLFGVNDEMLKAASKKKVRKV